MSQIPPNGPQIPLDNQQQPQWQPQSMPGLQQPQPQYANMQPEGAPMPAQIPTQPTPTLDAMYSQGQQPYDQPGGQQQYQQDFAQQPHDFPANQQMPQDPQMRSQQQQAAPFATPFDQGLYTGQNPQNQQYPHEAVPPVHQENQGMQYPAFDPAASAWEQEHVTEVNDGSPFADFPQQGRPQKSQNQAARDAELLSRRQRVQALDEERVRQETLQAIAISARDAPDFEELEEQLQQQIHQAQLLSLDAWEQDIRRQIEGQGQANQPNAAYDDTAYTQMGAGMGQQGSAFSDPRGGYPQYSPTPTLQGHHAAQQAQYHPAASYAGASQAASGHQADFGHTAAPNISQAQSMHGYPTQMPPPMGMRAPSAAGFAPMQNPAASSVNFGFSSPPPPPQTPTRGVPIADAARNLTAEDQRRWDGFEAYQQRQPGQQGGGATPSEYTVRTSYDDGSEANTTQYGSKGKGRMV